MSNDSIENRYGFYLANKKIRSRKVPYDRMSPLGKLNHDAREHGMTYGQYVAYLERRHIEHKVAKKTITGRTIIV